MVRTKVFVGNLSFKTGEKDLAKEFEVAGKVASANIISRGSRSLGYGFVEMESEEEAKKAVELLNKKLIDNREINVEVARPRDENAPANNANANGGNNNNSNAPRRDRRPPAGGRKVFRRRQGNNNAPQQGQGAEGGAAPNAAAPGGSSQPRGPRQPRRNSNNSAPRQPRQPRPDRPLKSAPPNSVFVANLPFSVDDSGLTQIFTNLSLSVKSSHVVKERGKYSKGYGFVEFASAEDQQKALTADKSMVAQREIIVKAAFTEPPQQAKAESEPKAN